MRSYPRNSPQAAARIIALTLLADGSVAGDEMEALERRVVHEQLGMSRRELHQVLAEFSEDLASSVHHAWVDAGPVDERTLSDLMAEIDEPALRRKLLRLCVDLAQSDSRIAEGGSSVIAAAVEHWGLHREMLQPVLPHA